MCKTIWECLELFIGLDLAAEHSDHGYYLTTLSICCDLIWTKLRDPQGNPDKVQLALSLGKK